MKLHARHDTLIAIIGTAVLTIGYFLGVLAPGRMAARKIEAEIAQAHASIAQIPDRLAERTALQQRVLESRNNIERIETALPYESPVPEVLHRVASQAQRSGLEIARLEPLPNIEYSSYVAHPFHLSCRGTFADITSFLKGMESQPRLITFGNVSFTRGNEGPGTYGSARTVQANIDFSVFSRNSKTTKLTENSNRRDSSVSDN